MSDEEHCQHCGYPLPTEPVCPNCRAPIDAAALIASAVLATERAALLPDPVSQSDVDAYAGSLDRQGTPWAKGCAALIRTLWRDANK